MIFRIFRPLVPALACVLAGASGIAAQAPGWTVGSGAVFETYSFGDAGAAGIKSVALMTVPFVASFQPVTWANIGVSGAFASATAINNDDSESTVSGLTDTAVQLAIPLASSRLTVGATLMLPTGKSTYAQDEAQVAGIIAADLLPFRVSNWGSGGGIDLRTSAAASMGGLNVAGSLGYQVSREFDLVEEGEFMYRPGDQLYARIGADAAAGEGRVAAQVAMYRFGSDEVNSQNLYQAGNRIQGTLSYVTPLGRRGRAQLYSGALRRQQGVFLDGSGDTPAQTMIMLGGGLRQPVGNGLLMPTVDVRLLRSSDGEGQGYIAGAGAAYEIAFGAATFVPTARVRFGQLLVSEGVESGVTGFEIGALLRFGGGA